MVERLTYFFSGGNVCTRFFERQIDRFSPVTLSVEQNEVNGVPQGDSFLKIDVSCLDVMGKLVTGSWRETPSGKVDDYPISWQQSRYPNWIGRGWIHSYIAKVLLPAGAAGSVLLRMGGSEACWRIEGSQIPMTELVARRKPLSGGETSVGFQLPGISYSQGDLLHDVPPWPDGRRARLNVMEWDSPYATLRGTARLLSSTALIEGMTDINRATRKSKLLMLEVAKPGDGGMVSTADFSPPSVLLFGRDMAHNKMAWRGGGDVRLASGEVLRGCAYWVYYFNDPGYEVSNGTLLDVVLDYDGADPRWTRLQIEPGHERGVSRGSAFFEDPDDVIGRWQHAALESMGDPKD